MSAATNPWTVPLLCSGGCGKQLDDERKPIMGDVPQYSWTCPECCAIQDKFRAEWARVFTPSGGFLAWLFGWRTNG